MSADPSAVSQNEGNGAVSEAQDIEWWSHSVMVLPTEEETTLLFSAINSLFGPPSIQNEMES